MSFNWNLPTGMFSLSSVISNSNVALSCPQPTSVSSFRVQSVHYNTTCYRQAAQHQAHVERLARLLGENRPSTPLAPVVTPGSVVEARELDAHPFTLDDDGNGYDLAIDSEDCLIPPSHPETSSAIYQTRRTLPDAPALCLPLSKLENPFTQARRSLFTMLCSHARETTRHLNCRSEAIDECESSYQAADGHKVKAAMEDFDDAGLMAILCRHDILLCSTEK